MTTSGPHSFLQRHALGVALLAAPFVLADRAEAACAPATGNNVTVTCSGTTNGGAGIGYGSGFETGNTINVLSGARVTGGDSGISINSGIVNNAGTISATGLGGFGIAANTAIVNNTGTISGDNIGILANPAATVTNTGTIAATGVGGMASASQPM